MQQPPNTGRFSKESSAGNAADTPISCQHNGWDGGDDSKAALTGAGSAKKMQTAGRTAEWTGQVSKIEDFRIRRL